MTPARWRGFFRAFREGDVPTIQRRDEASGCDMTPARWRGLFRAFREGDVPTILR